MKQFFQAILFGSLILSACGAGVSSPRPMPVSTTEAPTRIPTTTGPDPTLIVTLSTPPLEQPPNGEITPTLLNLQDCGYQWANQALPELSRSFQQSVQALQEGAKADAYVFGENCFLSDGSFASFLPRETDFNVTLQVNTLKDESVLGSWIVKVMQIIIAIPREQLVGPLRGRVFLIFQAGGEQRAINFGIDQFQNLPPNLSDAEIFQALQVPQ